VIAEALLVTENDVPLSGSMLLSPVTKKKKKKKKKKKVV
jgi:hypothetical protein